MILDEAHLYCPERGSGEAKSTEAVISLMSQGRERSKGQHGVADLFGADLHRTLMLCVRTHVMLECIT